jgi:predicted Rossmann fold flavoprotein
VTNWDVIVVGGGAAGLMAAGEAAGAGARTLLLEKMPRPGRKLRITGKGRCNVTNTAEIGVFLDHFGKGGQSLRQAFDRYFSNDVMAFFESIGVPLVTERGGRVFPASGRAQDVVDAMVVWAKQQGAQTRTGTTVDALLVEAGGIVGVRAGKDTFRAPCVILATGGSSYPGTGSTGDGYRLAAAAGHSIVDPRPALVPLEVSEGFVRGLAGLSLRNIRMRVFTDGTQSDEQFGELAFMEYGVSGPVVLTASGAIVDSLHAKQEVVLAIDLKPALSEEKLNARLLRDFSERGNEPMHSVLRGLLPKPLVKVCLIAVGIPGKRLARGVTGDARKRLLAWLKDMRLTIRTPRPIKEAIVTAGGVSMEEVDPRTMASTCVKGLYVVGELLDVHADTGGYNLQAAFSTGWLAGRSVSNAELGMRSRRM